MRVQFLGSGTPFAAGGKMQACILLDGAGGRALLDCGATSLLAMDKFSIDPSSIDLVIITHFHGDHIGGLPFLLMDREFHQLEGARRPARVRPLVIAGPRGIEERVVRLTELMEYGNAIRQARARGMLQFVELEPGEIARVGSFAIEPIAVRHTPEALGVRLLCDGQTIAYSGDAGWSDALLKLSHQANLFICCAYTYDISESSMLSYAQLQQHRAELTCQRLILTHAGANVLEHRADLVEEVAEDGLQVIL